MAHVKAGSSNAHQKANVAGKHRGLKVNQGQFVRGGQILVKQTGVVYKPGQNAKLSRDSSVVSRVEGIVMFSYLRRPNGVRTVVNVMPKNKTKVEYKVMTASAKAAAPKVEKTVKAEKAPKAAKKVAKAPKKTVAKKAAK